MRNGHRYPLFLVLIFAIAGCNSGLKSPDVSHIPMNITLSRFGREFINLDTVNLQTGLQKLNEEYPVFFPVYMNQIMNFNYSPEKKSSYPVIKEFIQSKNIRSLQDTINTHFPDEKMKEIKNELNESFRYIKYYLPDFHPPKVVTFMSALSNYGAITVDSVLGIGLDMFLGKDFTLYKKLANPYPGYILKRFSPNHLVVGCIKALIMQKYPVPEKGTLLDHMIARGKILYFLDKVLPQTVDEQKILYSEEELNWCKKNEQFIWQYFIRNELLYKTESLTIRYYIGPGPSSRGLPDNAPGNIGSWIGWQIVRQYMAENPKTTLAELMEQTDGQKILNQSDYHPH